MLADKVRVATPAEEFTLSADADNYNIFVDAFGSPTEVKPYVFNVADGVTIGSVSVSTHACFAGSFPAGSKLIVVLKGSSKIAGRGGAGGNGGIENISSPTGGQTGGLGFDASDATNYTLEIRNTGTGYIAAGSGGGGGGGSGGFDDGKACADSNGGAGGRGQGSDGGAASGSPGTEGTGGTGGTGGSYSGGGTGITGNNGSSSASCSKPSPMYIGAAGGAWGTAVTGESNVVWNTSGTIYGGTTG
jgi:hypothetical protein